VETDVSLEPNEFDQLQGWLEQPESPETSQKIVTLLHGKVTQLGNGKDQENAKKMFSAGFGLLP
jgi:hypothetical protein